VILQHLSSDFADCVECCNFGGVKKSIKICVAAVIVSVAACSGRTAATSDDSVSIERGTFDADSAFAYVARQTAMGPRFSGMPGHEECRRWLVGELSRHGADTVMEQHAVADGYGPMVNIMARFNVAAERRILLMAHWDTRPWADNDADAANRRLPIDGANDGGSGVAVLLEIARQLGTEPPSTGVDILLVDAEDSGSQDDDSSWARGTQYWVAHQPYQASGRPGFGILLDMVGGRDAKFHHEYFSRQYAPAVVDRVWAIAGAIGHADRFVNRMGGGVNDDHIHVNAAGIPCIDIIECAHPATGSFNPTWHTLDDNLDNIDRATLKAVGETVMTVIRNAK